jgi:hypothetical protein
MLYTLVIQKQILINQPAGKKERGPEEGIFANRLVIINRSALRFVNLFSQEKAFFSK